jgi:hypothetical protein
MDGHALVNEWTGLPAPRLRLKGSVGMARDRAAACVEAGLAEGGAWAPQRSTASHVVQAGGQGPIAGTHAQG